ncbi:hypothetical protein ACFYNO_11515 [Kitasatospora sp. NPDC006697]|uniref:hypothetical protein n=1 Tax=Kitasatospora sp. NPDC006697 TaxID=3364020 RepID=UPI0036A745F4
MSAGEGDGAAEGSGAEPGGAGLAAGNPHAGEGAGGTRTYREVRQRISMTGSGTFLGADSISTVNIGAAARPVLLTGPVPEADLTGLASAFVHPPGYPELARRLDEERLLVLAGVPGTGRTACALTLLNAATGGRVLRLDPDCDLAELAQEDLKDGHGYLLEPAAGSAPDPLVLDRFHAQLAGHGARAVLLVEPNGSDGRHRAEHRPPDEERVVHRHLWLRLPDLDPEEIQALVAAAREPQVRDLLGLEELFPAEAAGLAALLADRRLGTLTEEAFEAACAGFAPAQAARWFGTGRRADSAPALRAAALRTALAVLDGAPLHAVVEAAEQLAWEFGVTVRPKRTPGRPVFADSLDDQLAAARAVAEPGTESVSGTREAAITRVRFRGARLGPAVLEHLWQQRPNARGPLIRWLTGLAGEDRAAVSVRAALTGGRLFALDGRQVLEGLIGPLVAREEYWAKRAVGLVLAEAAEQPGMGPVVHDVIGQWLQHEEGEWRAAAAAALCHPSAARSRQSALDRIARLALTEVHEQMWAGAEAVVELAVAGPAGPVLARIRRWLSHRRPEYQNLGLVSSLWLIRTRVWQCWNPTGPLLEREDWPIGPALVVAEPELALELAGLLWTALNTPRSYLVAREAVSELLRAAPGKEWAGPLLRLLGLSLATEDDRNRMFDLVDRLERDYDPPLDPELARRLREAAGAAKELETL